MKNQTEAQNMSPEHSNDVSSIYLVEKSLPAVPSSTGREADDCTQSRLLQAAGEVFADRGYRDATVREICDRAGINHAAINYYFDSKRELYSAVVRHVLQFRLSEPLVLSESAASCDQKVHECLSLLMGVCNSHSGRPIWHSQLIVREITAPTKTCRPWVEAYIRARYDVVRTTLDELFAAEMPAANRHAVALFILVQIEQSATLQTFASMLDDDCLSDAFDGRRLATTITRFCLAALDGLAKSE